MSGVGHELLSLYYGLDRLAFTTTGKSINEIVLDELSRSHEMTLFDEAVERSAFDFESQGPDLPRVVKVDLEGGTKPETPAELAAMFRRLADTIESK